MKRSMLSGLGLALAGAAMLAGPPSPAQAQVRRLTTQEIRFIREANSGGLAEVQAGQLAQSRAQMPAVRDFAAAMVHQHTANNRELISIIEVKGMSPLSRPDDRDAAQLTKLQAVQGSAFDGAYLKGQMRDHMAMARLLQEEIRLGHDDDLKAYAQKTLPVVEQHLDMIRQLRSTKTS